MVYHAPPGPGPQHSSRSRALGATRIATSGGETRGSDARLRAAPVDKAEATSPGAGRREWP
jgi:hypothetical protein